MVWREISELADEETGTALYYAADLFKSVLNCYTRESHPLDWVYVHFEYGRTFLRLALGLQNERRHDAANAAADILRIAADAASMQDTDDLLRMELALALTCLAQCPQTKNSLTLLRKSRRFTR